MSNTRLLFCVLLTLFTNLASAQHDLPQNRVWAMGREAGLDFSTAVPTPITTGLASGNEGCASVCDSNGNLLFYTNGTDVWDASGARMPNGTNINGATNNTISTTQGALIVPDPGNDQRYYLFSLTSVSDCKLFCNVVDMRLNNTLGDIDQSFPLKDSLLSVGLTEKMVAVPGCNENVWVLVRHESEGAFKAFEITAAGLNTVPVSSVAGNFPNSYYTQGVLKPSPDGSRLITCNFKSFSPAAGLEVYDFDKTTGMVSNPLTLDSGSFYGGTFAPGSQRVYAQTTTFTGQVYQFDLTASNPAASKLLLGPSGQYADMKLGPDGKIYFGAMAGSPGFNNYLFLGCINDPDMAGAGCNFQDSVTALSFPNASQTAGKLAQGLPNTVVVPRRDTAYIFSTRDTVICYWPEDAAVAITAEPGFSGYRWDDGSTDAERLIQTPGTYWVASGDFCQFRVDTIVVEYLELDPQITIREFELGTTRPYSSYQWLFEGALLPGETDSILIVHENGDYQVIVSDGNCVDTSAIYPVNNADIGATHPLANLVGVYPNPASTFINIQAPIELDARLVSLEGKVLQQLKNARKIRLDHVTAGMYLLQLWDKKGMHVKTEKIIIQSAR